MMSDDDFIRRFLNIKLNNICKKYDYNLANIMNGTASKEKRHNCRVLIEDMLTKLLDESRGINNDNSDNIN